MKNNYSLRERHMLSRTGTNEPWVVPSKHNPQEIGPPSANYVQTFADQGSIAMLTLRK